MRLHAVALALCLAAPAAADPLREWYEYYGDAERFLRRNQCTEALPLLRKAVEIRSRSGVEVRTYGIEFVDYLPYYRQGACHLRLGDFNLAVQMFNSEEKQGAIQKKPELFKELVRQRAEAELKAREEAESAERQRQGRLALAEVTRLMKEEEELYKEGKLEEALARLASAQELAKILEPGILQQVVDRSRRIRDELAERQRQAQRAEDIERGLAEGRRLLETDPAQAKVRFEGVLKLDAQNAAALEGRHEADAAILALTTRQERAAAFEKGKALAEAGRFEEALGFLATAAADPGDAERQRVFKEVQRRVEGIRTQKAERLQIEGLLAAADRLLAQRKFAEAVVALNTLLGLDPSHQAALQKRRHAEHMTGENIFERIVPNEAPVLTFVTAPDAEVDVEGPTLGVVGVATDDRGLMRIEYRAGGAVVAQEALSPSEATGDYPRSNRIQHLFDLTPGANEIAVAAYDTSDAPTLQTFRINRRLRFYETRAFLPAAAGGALALLGLAFGANRLRKRRAVVRRFNPYIAGAPVLDDDMFFGREKLLARILNVLHHNSLMITGERRIGKTTFLYHLKKTLQEDTGSDYHFFPVFTDLQGVTEEDFFRTVMADVVEALDLQPDTRAALRLAAAPGGAYEGRDFSHDLQRVIEELKTRTPKRVKLALLIDEVDVLNEFSERINQRLRSIFMKTFSEQLVAVMSGVGIRRVWNSEGSPWYNFFDEIELSGFTREEAEALVREPVAGYFRYEPEALEAILSTSQLKPYVIQKLCIHAVNHMLEEGRSVVTLADVEAGREALGREADEEQEPRRPAPAARATAGSVAD